MTTAPDLARDRLAEVAPAPADASAGHPAAGSRMCELLDHFDRVQRRSAAWRACLKKLVADHAAIESELHQVIAEALQLREMAVHQNGAGLDLRAVLENHERTLILWALACTGGRQDHAAAMLGVGPTTLGAKIKRLSIAVVQRHVAAPDGLEA